MASMQMNESGSEAVERSLAGGDIHKKWYEAYYVEQDVFYELAFDYVTANFGDPGDSVVLDAGCGYCTHAIRLAKRGFLVQAVDFSPAVLELAADNVKTNGLEARISLSRANIVALPFADGAFGRIVCWGVLMHVPEAEKAIAELIRVLSPGGTLIISENNVRSLEFVLIRNLKRLRGTSRNSRAVKGTPAGMEHWLVDPAGTLLVRQTNIRWLIEQFRDNGCILRKRTAGQFTELYTRVSNRLLRSLIRVFNSFWFRHIRIPHLAIGNILIFQKERRNGQ